MTKFNMRFDGLVSFVPKRPEGSNEAPEEVLMVLPDLLRPQPLRIGSVLNPNFRVKPPSHYPALVIEEPYIDFDASDKRPVLGFEKPNEPGRWFFLYRFVLENLFVSPIPGAGPLIAKPDQEPPGIVPADSHEEKSLSWIASLEKARLTGAEVFNRELVFEDNDVPKPGSDRGQTLVGTVTLSQGTLQATHVKRRTKNQGTEMVAYQFSHVHSKPEEPVFRQAVSDGSEHVIEFDGNAVDLIWRRYLDEPRRLRLHDKAGVGVIPVRVANLELEEILGVGMSTDTGVPSKEEDSDETWIGREHQRWDMDPAVFYHLSKYYDQFSDQPLPVAEIPEDDGGRGGPGCEPFGYKSWA